jgi:hypothetical protein
MWARNPAYFPPDESAAAHVSAPRHNTQASLSDEDEYLRCVARGKAIQERIAARETAVRTQSSSSSDRAANKPGAFQGIVNCLGKEPALEPPAVRRIVDVAADKDQWKEFLAGTDLQSAAPASAAVCKRNSSPKHIRGNSPGKGASSPAPAEVADPNQDQDRRAKESSSAEPQDLSKSDDESDSSSEDVDGGLFLENLEKLATSGDLDTVEGVRQAFVNAFGEEMLVSGGLSSTSLTSYFSALTFSIALSRITKTSKTK